MSVQKKKLRAIANFKKAKTKELLLFLSGLLTAFFISLGQSPEPWEPPQARRRLTGRVTMEVVSRISAMALSYRPAREFEPDAGHILQHL